MFLVTRHTKKKLRPVPKSRLIYLQIQRDYTQIFDTDDSGNGRDGILQQYRIGFGRYTLPLGLLRQVFLRKDEPRTRKTRAAAVTLHMLTDQLPVV